VLIACDLVSLALNQGTGATKFDFPKRLLQFIHGWPAERRKRLLTQTGFILITLQNGEYRD
jgi:hypothetical protein